MASILRIKRSELVGNPTTLAAGELAYSAAPYDTTPGGGRLYIGTGTETNFDAINHVVIGGKYFTDIIDAATNLGTNNTLVKRNNTNTAYLNIIGNVTGNLTGNLIGDIQGNVVGNVTGDLTGNVNATTGSSVFNNVTVNGKLFGDVVGDIYASNGTTKILENGIGNTATFTGNVTGDVTGGLTGNVTGNVTGNLTGNATTASSWLTARNLSLTGDGTATLSNVTGGANVSAALTLASVNSNIGTYGSATAIPVVTVNAKGLVTAVTSANIATTLSIAGSTGSTGSVGLLSDTLTFAAGSGLKTSFNDATNSLLIEMDGSGAAELSALTLSGALAANTLSVTTTMIAGDTTVNDLSINGNAIVTGNLTVNGVMTAVNSTTVTIADRNLELATNANTAILSDGGGITVGKTLGGFTSATLTYSAIDNRWNMNKELNVTTVHGALNGNAATTTKWATARTFSLTGDATGSLASVDGTANVSAALTLATVNSNTGSFGTSTVIPNFTVNAKGLIVAAGSSSIPFSTTSVKGIASFDSTQFSVTSGAVSIATVDGGSY
jgi:hypothetical protein